MADDDLYARYQHAYTAWRAHHANCQPCRAGTHCPVGTPIHQRLTDLQDSYLRRIRSRGGKR
ncbi:hypothetical protein [Streptomyces atratus]|uniref:hypothetical protein n=1 Tax=Streptomyces atratus TaxID=1893 RepID=UPI0021A63E6F|nr:hypothetical protein [Streptomyces atratus]MCT2546246.1 hypothetical protein [Streptomyces atratus]